VVPHSKISKSVLTSEISLSLSRVCKDLWVCADGTASKFYGDVDAYKSLIVGNAKKMTPT